MIGNKNYSGPNDIPDIVPVFPLSAALLLPRGQLPLNIFEPRYVAMIDHALAGDRVIGMVQPVFDGAPTAGDGQPDNGLCTVGCLGRITSMQESGDGRYIINLSGIVRYHIVEEVASHTPFLRCRISCNGFDNDFTAHHGEEAVDRTALIDTFRTYLNANDMEADWDSVLSASNETLVNAMAMMCPYGPAEKQALLEAPDLKTRAETLVAITEIDLARKDDTRALLQ